MKGTIESQDVEKLICSDYREANRLIRIMHEEILIHASGKRFWMWMFLASVFIRPFFEFISGVISGISQ